jgi:hypothetical protein
MQQRKTIMLLNGEDNIVDSDTSPEEVIIVDTAGKPIDFSGSGVLPPGYNQLLATVENIVETVDNIDGNEIPELKSADDNFTNVLDEYNNRIGSLEGTAKELVGKVDANEELIGKLTQYITGELAQRLDNIEAILAGLNSFEVDFSGSDFVKNDVPGAMQKLSSMRDTINEQSNWINGEAIPKINNINSWIGSTILTLQDFKERIEKLEKAVFPNIKKTFNKMVAFKKYDNKKLNKLEQSE